jgi:hypothetical protein
MNEHFNNAETAAEMCVANLRIALGKATAVESLVIIPLIERAATLARDIHALDDACIADGRE